ncbi:Predicted arabinose efflux permease, MFS family [Bacteroides luti]|uniref:Predicted arabinose efflux permease, MFS family n=1 Tax=Bacteroides luti TaxID=1297750 RepID=A0A1M5H5V2_9BACE|nr:MFS transporter [Bacteroides luti]SHG11266.1 Predicted arabinose efflux permease, MFS family [Bacteroides luti]
MKRFLYKFEVGKFDGLKGIFRSLRYRNYRLFFSGQSLSLIGTWVQRIAIPWLVYRLTGSAFLLGFVGFAGQIPTFILAPFAGVLTDRLNRYHIMIVSQILSMIQALALALLFFTNTIEVWNVLLLSVIQGCINAFDTPARQSFVIEMVEDKNDIGNAVALNSSMFNGARLVGPSIAGVLIASLGEGACFLINGISYIFVVISLLLMKVKPQEKKTKDTNIIKEFKEGFTYTFGFPPIRSIIILLTLISLMGMPFSVLMPIFAKDIFHGGSHIFGFLMGASGVGALIGAAYLASRKSVVGLEKIIPLAAVVFGLGLVSFSLSSSFPLSIILMIITGVGMMMQTACSNTILQTISDNDKRGRVMSFYTMAFMGTAPIGSFLAGSMASMIGAPATLLIGGIACVIGALVFAQKLPLFIKLVRPIYIQLGIIDNAANK